MALLPALRAVTVAFGLLGAAACAAPLPDDVCHTPADTAPASLSTDPMRSLQTVVLPAIRLRPHVGSVPLELAAALADDRPVLLNFIFTSCTTVCPPMAQIFAATQERLGARREQVRMVSVSIDPGHDTPARLREYAARFDAGTQWRFLTGSAEAVDAVQRAFNVYRPDKMGHTPVTFVRPRGARQWVRLDGFSSPERLIREAFGEAP
jgi:protein SCO1/2